MLDTTQTLACLFDLDGVILDTETQYSVFWVDTCKRYLNDGSLGNKLKGQSLELIYKTLFPNQPELCAKITEQLDAFEASMKMEYIPGFPSFITQLKEHGVKTAIVTSSNKAKMQSVKKNRPELWDVFDFVLTAEQFAHSKPAPDPYLLGAEKTQAAISNCVVFEDSFNGLKSGRAAQMKVVGLATTNPKEAIKDYADMVISDFTEITYDTIIHL